MSRINSDNIITSKSFQINFTLLKLLLNLPKAKSNIHLNKNDKRTYPPRLGPLCKSPQKKMKLNRVDILEHAG